MQGSERLKKALHNVCRHWPLAVIETGTYLGEGSTRFVAEAMRHSTIEYFYTIESNKQLFEQAKKNLSDLQFIECLHGLSVWTDFAENFVLHDKFLRGVGAPEDIYVDTLGDPIDFYLRELRANPTGGGHDLIRRLIMRHGLNRIVEKGRTNHTLFVLDSCGGIGWLEFRTVVEAMGGAPFSLLLDDTHHVKHYRSWQHILAHPEIFMVVDHDEEAGWGVAHANLYTTTDG